MTGLTVAQIHELTELVDALATKRARHQCRSQWHLAAAAQADLECRAAKDRLAKLARDSQHEVSHDWIAPTVESPARPDDTGTPPVPGS